MLAVSLAMTLMGLFVSPDEAAALISARPGAAVLDARDVSFWGFRAGHLPGAVPIDWKRYRDGWGRTGRLGDPAEMAARLARLGVDEARPVLVYGDGVAGFGEEGRIAWLLLYLGHGDVHILDGGIAAWRAAGRPLERGGAGDPPPGRFTARPQQALRAEKERARAVSVLASGPGAGVLVDVRTDGEWRGRTPYFEARGGHIPGAVHLPWTRLFDERGRVLPRDRLLDVLLQAGVVRSGPGGTPAAPEIILYCTGGVRSAMAWAALRAAGLRASNYDGSFWEWAADRSLPVALPAGLPAAPTPRSGSGR
jgi:thiosulfate/3-mercaptopyruvate sulfurtransferase